MTNQNRQSAATFGYIMVKYAEEAEKKKDKPSGDELLKTRGFGSVLGDFVYPWMGNRAGTATAMGLASGEDVPFRVRYPATGQAGDVLGLGALGGLGGAALGAGIGGILDGQPGEGAATGAAIGVLGGAFGGLGVNFFKRRYAQRDLKKNYDEADELDIDKAFPDHGITSSILGFMGGPHRIGRHRTAMELLEGEARDSTPRHVRNVGQGLAGLPGVVIPGAALITRAPFGMVESLLARRGDTRKDT